MNRTKRLETFYVMTSKDVSVEAEAAFVQNLLTSVIENVIVEVRVMGSANKDTPTQTCVETLKKTPNLFVREI